MHRAFCHSMLWHFAFGILSFGFKFHLKGTCFILVMVELC